ncbi:MAG: hypothetical protein V1736_03550 [Pseudomonadota bacterium]
MRKLGLKRVGILFITILGLIFYVVSAQGAGYEKGSGTGMEKGAPQAGAQRWQAPIDQEEAKAILQNYVSALNDPNLKLGDLNEKGKFFEADIRATDSNKTVEKVRVDKQTGVVHPARKW